MAALVIREALVECEAGHADVVAVTAIAARVLEPDDVDAVVDWLAHVFGCFGRRSRHRQVDEEAKIGDGISPRG